MSAPYAAVVGAVNMDVCGRPFRALRRRDSNPGTVTLTPGGVGRNIAHDLCLFGERVSFLTVFGGDANAAALRQHCLAQGMELSCAGTIPDGRTSAYLYITDADGEMELGVCDTDLSRCITPEYLRQHAAVLRGASAVVMDGNLETETLLWLGTHCGRPLFADPVSAAKAERLLPVLPYLHTLKPNLTEGRVMTGETAPEAIVSALLSRGVRRVILSLGADGILAGEGTVRLRRPCLPTKLVDATGGGDAVTAALVRAELHGQTLTEAVEAALRAGRCAVEHAGTNPAALAGVF